MVQRPQRFVAFSFAMLAIGGAFAVALLPAGCGSDSQELFTVRHDAGSDGDARDDAEPGIDPTLGGPCTDDAQCDDLVPCTYDRCDQALSRCRNTPDDSLCADD